MQLQLFQPTIISESKLIAISTKYAFYEIKLIFEDGKYFVEKISGAAGKVLDRRKWEFESFAKAEKFYQRKLNEKLSGKNRKRVYQMVA